MEHTEWAHCPVCGNRTRIKIREDTELNNFPLFCPKRKQEALIKKLLASVQICYTYKRQVRQQIGLP